MPEGTGRVLEVEDDQDGLRLDNFLTSLLPDLSRSQIQKLIKDGRVKGPSRALRASAVRWWPGGEWTSLVRDRNVELAVGPGALVDSTLAAALASTERRALQSRSTTTFTAFTARSKVTAAALRGTAGALVATRVTRPGGTTVSTEAPQPAQADPVADDAILLDPGAEGDERTCVYPDPGCSGS